MISASRSGFSNSPLGATVMTLSRSAARSAAPWKSVNEPMRPFWICTSPTTVTTGMLVKVAKAVPSGLTATVRDKVVVGLATLPGSMSINEKVTVGVEEALSALTEGVGGFPPCGVLPSGDITIWKRTAVVIWAGPIGLRPELASAKGPVGVLPIQRQPVMTAKHRRR